MVVCGILTKPFSALPVGYNLFVQAAFYNGFDNAGWDNGQDEYDLCSGIMAVDVVLVRKAVE